MADAEILVVHLCIGMPSSFPIISRSKTVSKYAHIATGERKTLAKHRIGGRRGITYQYYSLAIGMLDPTFIAGKRCQRPRLLRSLVIVGKKRSEAHRSSEEIPKAALALQPHPRICRVPNISAVAPVGLTEQRTYRPALRIKNQKCSVIRRYDVFKQYACEEGGVPLPFWFEPAPAADLRITTVRSHN